MPSLNPFRFNFLIPINTGNYLYNSTYADYKTDIYQKIITDCIFGNDYTLWLIVVLLLNMKRWKRPVIYILILFWAINFLNRITEIFISLFKPKENTIFPYEVKNSRILGLAVATLYLSQIVGDWYPILRTKAVVYKKGYITLINTTCILYNIGKFMSIISTFMIFPQRFDMSDTSMMKLNSEMSQNKTAINESMSQNKTAIFQSMSQNKTAIFQSMSQNKMPPNNDMNIKKSFTFYIIIMELIYISSILYDVSIIYVLRKNVFKKEDNQFKEKQSFIEKFKKISEYRIFLSIIINLLAVLVMGLYGYINFHLLKNGKVLSVENSFFMTYYEIVNNFNYKIMFIDQILLRFYAEDNNPQYKNYTNSNSNTRNIGITNTLELSTSSISNPKSNYESDINSDINIHKYNVHSVSNIRTYDYNNDYSSCYSYYNNHRRNYYQNEMSCSPKPLISHHSNKFNYYDDSPVMSKRYD